MTTAKGADPAVSRAYDAASAAWASGPERVLYDPLGRVLVGRVQVLRPHGIEDALVLDVGSGTGAAARAATRRGATVVATDAAPGMLRRQPQDPSGPRGRLAADAGHLPFAEATFDVVLAAFVLNHLPDPTVALAEAGRVARPGGLVAASTFCRGWDHPVKHAVDGAAARLGFHPPPWYLALKTGYAPRAGEPDALVRDARAAGLHEVDVVDQAVEVPVDDVRDLVEWRLGMGHLAPFVATLSAADRARLVADAVARLPEEEPGLRPRVLLLTAET